VRNDFFSGLAYCIPAGLVLWAIIIIIWEAL